MGDEFQKDPFQVTYGSIEDTEGNGHKGFMTITMVDLRLLRARDSVEAIHFTAASRKSLKNP